MTNQEYYEKLCKDSEKLEKLCLMNSDRLIDTIETIRDYYQLVDVKYVGLERGEIEDLDMIIRILKEIRNG